MSILFWILFIIACVCIVAYIVESINQNHYKCNMIEFVAYIVLVLLLVVAVISNKELVAW